MPYRPTPGRGPLAAFKNVSPLLGPTVTEVDPKTGVKVKEKENRKGEKKQVIIIKDDSGKRTKITNIKGPVIEKNKPAPKPVEVTFDFPGTASSSIAAPKQTITPGGTTEGSDKPMVKPLGYKEAYEKTDKSIPFEEWKEKAIRWREKNPGKTTAPKLDIIKAKPAQIVNPGTSSTFTMQGVPTTSTSTYESTKRKVRDFKLDINLPKIAGKIDINLPKRKKERGDTPYCKPGSKSLSCVGGGSAGFNLLTPGEGSKGLQAKETRKVVRQSKRQKRKLHEKKFVGFSNLGHWVGGKVKPVVGRLKRFSMGSGLK